MWVKVDDGFPDHAKVYRAGQLLGKEGFARAVAVFLTGLCWSARNFTDGFLPPVHEWMPSAKVTNVLQVAEVLVTVGLWERGDNGFWIHDYHDYQPAAASVKQKREKDRTRKTIDSTRNPRGKLEESERNPLNIPLVIPSGISSDSERNPERSRGTGSGFSSPKPVLPTGSVLRTELPLDESIRWFDKVYGLYPNKDRKMEANRAWIELAPPLEIARLIFTDIERRKQAGWVKLERRFIPQLVTYLRERMWEDATPIEPFDDEPETPYAWQCAKCGLVHEGTREQSKSKPCLKRQTGEPVDA